MAWQQGRDRGGEYPARAHRGYENGDEVLACEGTFSEYCPCEPVNHVKMRFTVSRTGLIEDKI